MDERTDRTSQTPPRASKCPRRLFRVASCFQTRREPSTERRRLERDGSRRRRRARPGLRRRNGTGAEAPTTSSDAICVLKAFLYGNAFFEETSESGGIRHRTRTRTRRRRTARRESARRCGTSPPPPTPAATAATASICAGPRNEGTVARQYSENVTRRPLRGLRLVKRRARSGVRNASRIKQTQRAGARERRGDQPAEARGRDATAHAGKGSRGKETLDKPDVGPKRDVGAAYAAKAASSSASAEILAEIDVRASPSSGNRDAPSSDPLPLPPTRAVARVRSPSAITRAASARAAAEDRPAARLSRSNAASSTGPAAGARGGAE